MPATWGEAIDVPLLVAPPLPEPTPAETICWPGAATSGLPQPSEPWTPRDEDGLRVSAPTSSRASSASDGPIRTVSVPASISGSSARVVSAVIWKPGMPVLPAIPAENTGSVVGSSTPTAPAVWALLNRTPEPHARVASSSSHARKAIFPFTAAACSAVKAVQPSKPSRSATGAVTSSPE